MLCEREAFLAARDGFASRFGGCGELYFAPGRTELIGNHTDHQRGRVIAAAVDRGIFAAARKNGGDAVRVLSRGFEPFEVDVRDLAPREGERGSPAALLRGAAFALREAGGEPGGFDLCLCSELRAGGGLSSSAAFSVLAASVMNGLFCGGRFSPGELAVFAGRAENLHFGKPCGLMDQTACALGGAVYMDFLTGERETLPCDLEAIGLVLCLTDTGGSHAGLDAAYGQIPADMRFIAAHFGKETLAEVRPEDFFAAPHLPGREREEFRAAHFFDENARVPRLRDAILCRDATACIELMNASGRSSEGQLRNIYLPGGDASLLRGLELSAGYLDGVGAWRVHGGGFAGCVQALMPGAALPGYRALMEESFGAGSCRELRVFPAGAGAISEMECIL